MTRARSLARLANENALSVNTDLNVGVNSTSPVEKLNVVGVVSATSFFGDGTGLTGVASTDNIITGTAATFNSVVKVGTGITLDATSGIVTATGVNVTGVVTVPGDTGGGSGGTINITVLPASPIVTPPPGTLLDISTPNIVPQDVSVGDGSQGTFDPFTLSPGGLGSINDLNIGTVLTGFPDIDDPSITSCF